MPWILAGRRSALALALLLSCASAAAAPPETAGRPARPVLHHETYVLANGLRVILHEDHALPVCAVNLWYYVGAKDEPPGRSGFAHLFEHLMFMGTTRVPDNQYDVLMEAAGGGNNASTSYDRTNYFESGPSSLLPTLLWLEADRMEALGPAMTQEKLDLQREVVRNERRQSYEIAPYGGAELAIGENMFPRGHPYRLGVIGSHEEIEAATVADVKGFFARFYVPNNAALVVAGDFDPATVKPLIERLFGSLPRGEDPARNVVPPVTLPAPRRLHVADAHIELPRLSFVWHSPPYYQPGDAEMDLLGAVLADGRTSRLYKSLVYGKRTAQDVSAHQQSMALGSLFQIDVTASPDADLDQLEKDARAELARLLADGPTPEELARAVNTLESDRMVGLQSLSERADALNGYQFWMGQPDGLEHDLARYRVPPAVVTGWGRRVLDTPNHLTVRVTPPPTLAAGSRDQRPGDAPASTFALPLPERWQLANGMSVWHLARPGLPLVSMRLEVDAGAVHDPPGKNGLASLSADLLDEGAGARDALAFPQAVADLGARLGAHAERDGAVLTLEVLRRNLEPALDLFVDVATAPRLETADVERVRARTVAGLQQQDADPTYTAGRLGLAAWFGGTHPYGAPAEGRPVSVAALTPEDVRAFAAARWRPERATLLVAGDVTREQLEPLLARRLGAWKAAGASPEAPRLPAAAGETAPFRVLVADRPGAAQTVVRFVLPGPTYDCPDREALEALNTLFGASFTSRLNANLREDKGFTYGAGSAFGFLRQSGTFIASSAVRRAVTGPAVAEFLEEFRRIRTGDVSAEEAGKAGATRRQDVVQSAATLGGLLEVFGTAVMHGREPRSVADDLARIERGFPPEELNALAQRHLGLERGVLVLVGDKATILEQLAGLSLPKAVVVNEP